MSAPSSDCPRCHRTNSAFRATCLYCGEAMPNPRPPPPQPTARAVPDNLDELVRKVMTGRASASEIQRAMERARRDETPPLRLVPAADRTEPKRSGDPEPAAAEKVPGAPTPAMGAGPSTPVPGGGADPFRTLRVAAREAEAAWQDQDAAGARARLADARTALEAALARIDAVAIPLADVDAPAPTSDVAAPAAVPAPPPTLSGILLPPIRLSHALALGPTVDVTAERIADALEVDLATARTLSGHGYARIALRSADAAELERRAGRARERGLVARVLAREDVLGTPPALTVLGRVDSIQLRVSDAAWWFGSHRSDALPAGELLAVPDVELVVLGEVEERELHGAESTTLRPRYTPEHGAERRRAVLDVHTPRHVLRIVAEACDFSGFPGFDATSPGRSLRVLMEQAASVWPAAIVTQRRLVPAGPVGAAGEGALRSSGWPAWEEHTRVCRLLR